MESATATSSSGINPYRLLSNENEPIAAREDIQQSSEHRPEVSDSSIIDSSGSPSREEKEKLWNLFAERCNFIKEGNFHRHFEKNNDRSYARFLDCQTKLMNVDMAFLKRTFGIDDPPVDISVEDSRKKLGEIDQMIHSVKLSLADLNASTPADNARGSYSLKLALTGALIAVMGAAVTASVFLLPITFPAVFIAGSGTLFMMQCIGTGVGFSLVSIGASVSIYHATANKNENIRKNELHRFLQNFSGLESYLNEMGIDKMLKIMGKFKNEMNDFRINEHNVVKAALERHENILTTIVPRIEMTLQQYGKSFDHIDKRFEHFEDRFKIYGETLQACVKHLNSVSNAPNNVAETMQDLRELEMQVKAALTASRPVPKSRGFGEADTSASTYFLAEDIIPNALPLAD